MSHFRWVMPGWSARACVCSSSWRVAHNSSNRRSESGWRRSLLVGEGSMCVRLLQWGVQRPVSWRSTSLSRSPTIMPQLYVSSANLWHSLVGSQRVRILWSQSGILKRSGAPCTGEDAAGCGINPLNTTTCNMRGREVVNTLAQRVPEPRQGQPAGRAALTL